jgi:hypothetical protein
VRTSRVAALALALAAGAAAIACRPARSARPVVAPSPAAASDSIEGTIRVVGVEAHPIVTLAFDGARPSLTLDGPPSLRRVDGLRVAVIGTRRGSTLVVTRFVVVAANGVPATDGVLSAEGGATVLTTADGVRHRLVNPPPLLRDNPGHRAWVSGPLDREPVAFGIVELE